MTEPSVIFTIEKVMARFGTRDALIDFLLDIPDIDKKKKLMNVFVAFRKVYNGMLPESPTRRQDAVSKDAGKVWEVEKQYNREFWKNILLDVYAEHKARFPWYWLNKEYIKSLETVAERQAAEEAWPQPKKRDRKRRSGAERTETSMTRPAPYSIYRSGPSSSFQPQSSHSSSSSFPTPTTTSHGSSSAAPSLPTPSSFPVYPSAHPTMTLDGHAGWQASGVPVASPMFPSVNHSLNGGQYMASIQPAPVVSSMPLDTQVQSHGTGQAEMRDAYYWEVRTVLGPSGPYRGAAFCHGARTICVGGDPLSQAAYALSNPSHRSVPGVSGIAYTPHPFQNGW